ncbi:alpha/beta hydrolase [Agrobacterium rhizogenes]|uniref:dienelactone hydrolase family protein n=1 Tax=Rhizobium rhizogenes TaxID=359 RepID=UPI001571B2C1|nr:dienelactone hydrolase family protein [Rhizobium rhizogenes]NTI03080.1 alpha/beta hydrolase [Rhizobium rhizogenes]NTI09884.1 alpha/beta hydrolase [Rhizobium rhizogenes]
MRATFAVVLTFLLFLACGKAEAAGRSQFNVATPGGNVLVEAFASSSGAARPAVIILSGSHGFAPPAYDELGRSFNAAGLDAYLVHLLSPTDQLAIARTGSAPVRIAYYATRWQDWIAMVRGVVSYLNNQPRYAGKVGVLGISLGAQAAAAASADRRDFGALVLVDGGFPDGYSQLVRSLPPLCMVWGSADRVFPVATARQLQRMAQGLGGSVSLNVYQGGAHNFFLKSGPQAAAAHQGAADFFLSQLSK